MEHPSLDAFLGALPSEELIEINRKLSALQAHEGWAAYAELLQLVAAKATHQLVHSPMPRSVDQFAMRTADQTGYIRGLDHASGTIMDKVSSKTKAVIEKLEREREDEAWTE